MSKLSYSEQLRDPRWQRKRLEIMQRDDFTCQKCFDSSETLNVHHCYYENGLLPWEYPDTSLLTLCEPCHLNEEAFAARKQMLIEAFGSVGFLSEDIVDFCAAFTSNPIVPRDQYFMSALCFWLNDADHRAAMVEIYEKHVEGLAKNREHPGGGPTADGQKISATGRDSCESGAAERRGEAGMEA